VITEKPGHGLSRRQYLALMAGAVGAASARPAAARPVAATEGSKSLRGAFMILNTPFSANGEVEWDDLVNEVRFVDRHGVQGVVWPQGSSGVTTLTKEERLHGMTLLAKTCRTLRVACVLGVQGKDSAEMVEYARHAETLDPDAFIAMPPTTGKSVDDYRAYFRTLAASTRRPVIQQTSGGARDLELPTDLIFELAREFPHLGYVKEESAPVVDRMRKELAQRPIMKGIFGASFATGWLFEMRMGLDGVITGESMYADLMGRMWNQHVQGHHAEVRDTFSKYLLIRNLQEQVPGVDLYVLKRRGIFKTMYTRRGQTGGGKTVAEPKLAPDVIEEIEFRLEALGLKSYG
jgi:dihydrodipicolinate synthase/N-acetylneuraminate lyase